MSPESEVSFIIPIVMSRWSFCQTSAYLYSGDVAAVAREEAAAVEGHGVNLAELGLGRQQPLRLERRTAVDAAAAILLEQDSYRTP